MNSSSDAGCLSGHKFSVTTGHACPSSSSGTSGSLSTASLFGQQVRTIATNLGQGSGGNSVTLLQQFLISQNKGPAGLALTNAGATGYFGALTRAALAEFQANVGISPALGNFGAITRAYISTHY